MENKPFIVALDQGTSGSRAFAVARDGSVLAQKSAPLAPTRPAAGLSEYDAQSLASSQLRVLNELLDELGPQHAAALAVTTQRSTVVCWDKQTGRPLAPVLTWEDGRAELEAEQADISQARVHEISGLYKTPYFSAAKIAWCFKHIPAVKHAWETKNLCVGPVASYLIWRLTGGKTFATDATLAQRMLLLDIHTQNWSEELCRSFAIDPQVLPQLLPSVADYGMYEYKGVRIPITVCSGDQQASVSFLNLQPGETCINYGTGAFLVHNAGAAKNALLPGMLSSLSVSRADGHCDFLLEGPVNAAASVLQWLNAQGISFQSQEIDALCESARHPVWFLPALGGLGAPYWDFSRSPVAAGLSPHTRKPDWVAGAVRSIAFLLTDIAQYLRANGFSVTPPVKVSGGLSRVKWLVQYQADLLQVPVSVLQEPESTVLGAARLAAEYAGWPVEQWAPKSAGQINPRLSAKDASERWTQWQQFVSWSHGFPLKVN